MRQGAFVIVAAAELAGCAEGQLMRTGALASPRTLAGGDPEIFVSGIKSGAQWTNVWIDLIVRSRGKEPVVFDPREFALYVPSTGVTIPASLRQFMVRGYTGVMGVPVGFAGQRDDDFRGGTDFPTAPTEIPAGAQVPATLMFETPRGGAKELEVVELVWRGFRLRLPPQAVNGMTPVQ